MEDVTPGEGSDPRLSADPRTFETMPRYSPEFVAPEDAEPQDLPPHDGTT
jgi:hypothetical protein